MIISGNGISDPGQKQELLHSDQRLLYLIANSGSHLPDSILLVFALKHPEKKRSTYHSSMTVNNSIAIIYCLTIAALPGADRVSHFPLEMPEG